ncbi:siphovirus Gp157 family protein [Paenibacillus filicis]|uniref:Siphovirus Gp157 family protein n=1 Tax=Paenibacillus filicis TaxID=669464 RepID=A0ABU9DRA7_9BACL
MQLYKISDNMVAVLELIESGQDGLEDVLEALNLSFEDKAENISKLYRSLLADRDACKAEAHRLSERAKHFDGQAERLKSYLEVQMQKIGMDKVTSSLFKIRLQMNPPSVVITDQSLLPGEYYTYPQPQVSKTKIKEDLTSGVEVPGAELKQEKSLRIS